MFARGSLGRGDLGRQQRSFLRRFGSSSLAVPWLREHAHQYDGVILHGLWNATSVAVRRALLGSAVPYFVFAHGALDPWFNRLDPVKTAAKRLWWLRNEGPVVHGARAVLFTCEEEMILARRAFRPYWARERVVGFGTDDAPPECDAQGRAFRAAVPALADRRYLLFLSRIHPKKGCDLLVDAFAALAGQHPALDLVMAGPDTLGLRAPLMERAAARGCAARVHWPGMLEGAAKWGAFRGCEAFVLPSHTENFGIVVAEALACGKPVLISDRVNIWREVEAGGAGLVRPDTPAGTAALLRDFLALPASERDAMGRAARATFLRHFRMEDAARRVADCLTEPA